MGGTLRSDPTPGSPRTLRDERSGRRPRQATGCRGAGLCAKGLGHREAARSPMLRPVPLCLPQVPALCTSRPVAQRARLLGARGAPRRGSRVRPPAACPPVPTAVPRPARPGPVAAPWPGRDSWVPKGLSRQRSGPSAPRAAGPPRAGPSAHAPARYLRSRSRSSSTWPLSPGGRPSARPLGSAPRTLLATRTQPGEEGRGGRLPYISIPARITWPLQPMVTLERRG